MNASRAHLLIDLQQEDGFPLHGFDEVIRNNIALADAVRAAGIPLLYSRHVNAADGSDLPPGEPRDGEGRPASYRAGSHQVEILQCLAPRAGDQVFDKPRYSCFHRSGLDARLKHLGVTRLGVSGVLTDACVLATVLDAFALGYRVDLVVDACTSTTAAAHYSATLIMANWVYAIELFGTSEYLRALRGEPHASWRPTEPDQFAHVPETLPQTIARLEAALQPQRPQE